MLSKFFLDRPVFAWVIAIIIMSVGILAIYNLPVSQYPQMAPPSIAVTAYYPGSSAETVENSVTQVRTKDDRPGQYDLYVRLQ